MKSGIVHYWRPLLLIALLILLGAAFRLVQLGRPPKEISSFHHLEEVGCIAFSPDGKYVAAGSRGVSRLAGDFWKGEVIVWELATKKKIGSVRLPVWAQSLAFSSDKFHLAVGAGVNWNGAPDLLDFVQKPGQVFLFEFPSLRERKRVPQGTAVLSVKFSPDGKTLASSSITSVEVAKGYVPGEVILWNVPGLKKKLQLKSVDNWDAPIAFSPKGEMLAVGEGFPRGKGIPKGVVKLVDSETGQKIEEISVGNESVKYVEFSPDGKTLAVLTYGGEAVSLWEVQTGKDVTPATFAKDFGDNKALFSPPMGSFLRPWVVVQATVRVGIPGY